MKLPAGTKIPNIDSSKHLHKLQQNLYGLKDDQVTWYEHMKSGLHEQRFQQSKIGPCLFVKDQVLLVLYIDGAAFFSPSAIAINKEVKSLEQSFNLMEEGEIQKYLDAHFIKHQDGRIRAVTAEDYQ